MAESSSPEPGSFPKRRSAALSRLTVPNETGEGPFTGLPSCHSDAPPLSARRSRLSKPGLQAEPVIHKALSACCLLLLVAVASVAMYRQKQLEAVLVSTRKQHQDEMSLQVAWLAASMSEHQQCKAALQKADDDYRAAKAGIARCEVDHKHRAEQAATDSRAATAHLQGELDDSRKTVEEATSKLAKMQVELSTTQQKQHQHQQKAEKLQQQLKAAQQTLQQEQQQWAKEKAALKTQQQKLQQDKEQSAKQVQELMKAQPPHSAGPQVPAAGALPSSAVKAADPHAALALPGLSPTAAASVAATDSSPSSPPVVVVTCAASDRSPDDLITPWSQAVVAAGVPHVLLVSDDAGCVAAAKAVGIKVLQHSFQAPNVTGPLAQQNLRSYRRYAALQQVLSLGHAVVSVEPEVLLLSDPQALLQQHPTDVTIMSTAWGDEHSAYGHEEHLQGTTATAAAPGFHIGRLSPGLLYLKPQPASLQFIEAMMSGLAAGQHTEAALLNTLLLAPWHIHTTQEVSASGHVPSLAVPVTVGVLPVSLFTSSEVVFKQADPKAWLKQQQPVAVQVLPGPSRMIRVQEVVKWLEADIQEVIQVIEHLPDTTSPAAATAAAADDNASKTMEKDAVVKPPAVPQQPPPQQQVQQAPPSKAADDAPASPSRPPPAAKGPQQTAAKSKQRVSSAAGGSPGKATGNAQAKQQQAEVQRGAAPPVKQPPMANRWKQLPTSKVVKDMQQEQKQQLQTGEKQATQQHDNAHRQQGETAKPVTRDGQVRKHRKHVL